jgi:2'-hydroxyisoflavone reductase
MVMPNEFPGVSRRLFNSALAASAWSARASAAAPVKILILGGTGFLGPATVRAAQAKGCQVTLFHRGKTRPDLFPDVETLFGDRDPDKGEGLKSLQGREWDVVIDNSGYFPRITSASAKLLTSKVKQYIFISSISVYVDNSKEGLDETAKVAVTPDPTAEKITEENYGALKALCEQSVEQAFPGRATIVRPGYIVGPDDPSGRFTYWPVRISRGGDVIAPGAPTDPVQFIDVRDLGSWLIHLAQNNITGTFNATGPKPPLPWGDLLKACQQASTEKSDLIWIPADWLVKQGAGEIFPIWAPYSGETRGAHAWSNARAIKQGLTFRPYTETVKDTLAWYKSQGPAGRTKLAGPSPEKEAELLAAWKAAQKQ